MSFNGSGTFQLNSGGLPYVTGTTISSTAANNLNTDLATGLSTCITKDGQTTITANIPMAGFKLTGLAAGNAAGNSLRYEQLFTTSTVTLLGAMDWVKGADIVSSGTINLTTATGNAVHVTGTTTITAVTLASGVWRIVIFDGALTLTHHTTNNNLPGGVNITTAAGDRALYWADGTTTYCVCYFVAATGAYININGATEDTNPDLAADYLLTYDASASLMKKVLAVRIGGGVLAAEVPTTSGATIDITGIPSWAKEIILQFESVSTNGTSAYLLQLGDAGGPETAGYLGAITQFAAATMETANINGSAGFQLQTTVASGSSIHGAVTFTLKDATNFTWIGTGILGRSDTTVQNLVSGSKSLSAALTQIRLTTANGTDTFDAGSIAVLYR